MSVMKAMESIYYVGALDPKLRTFDIIMNTEFGTTYNSYLAIGNEKVALFESVKDKFFDEHMEKIREVVDPSKIDYIVVSHTEPDHTGSLEKLLAYAPNAVVIGTQTAITFLGEIINKPFPAKAVTEKDSIDLGGMTMTFMPLPMLHWPDTMFTYIPEREALFTCDAFGCHYSDERIFNDCIEGDFYEAYRYYFDNIIGPYKKPFMTNALAKIAPLSIKFIGTGHGPALRENIDYYIDLYRTWCAGPARDGKRVVIAYVSAYGYTRALAESIREGILNSGVGRVDLFDLVEGNTAEALEAITVADGFLLGSPTMVGNLLPPVAELLVQLNPIIHKGKLAAAFGSYGWSGEAVGYLYTIMKQLKLNTPLEGFKVRLKPRPEDLEAARAYGASFAAELK